LRSSRGLGNSVSPVRADSDYLLIFYDFTLIIENRADGSDVKSKLSLVGVGYLGTGSYGKGCEAERGRP
jgi:hypothetical protein